MNNEERTATVKVELNVDFAELNQQYEVLLEFTSNQVQKAKDENDNSEETKQKIEALWGIIHFLEAYHSKASDILGEKFVFGC
jgi:hypothetical protein